MTTDPTHPGPGLFDGAEVIHRFTRADGIADGVLVDVTDTAREAGWRWPVAMTRAAWCDQVEWDPANAAPQDEDGRLWDVVFVAAEQAKRTRPTSDRMTVHVLRVPNRRTCHAPRLASFVVHIGPGDTPEPVVTIMLPGED